MTEFRSFNREKFLYWMLAGIFIFEGLLFAAGFIACWRGGGLAACPALGDRYESTFSVMVATTLALLTGGAVVGITQRSQSSDDDRDALASRPPQQLAPPSQPSISEQPSTKGPRPRG